MTKVTTNIVLFSVAVKCTEEEMHFNNSYFSDNCYHCHHSGRHTVTM